MPDQPLMMFSQRQKLGAAVERRFRKLEREMNKPYGQQYIYLHRSPAAVVQMLDQMGWLRAKPMRRRTPFSRFVNDAGR
jgi:hypothetical protein